MSKPKQLQTRTVHRGRVINLRVDTVDFGNGQSGVREVVEHPGGVVLVPVDDQQRILLVRQYRYPIDVTLLELPAGTLERGEDILNTAQRELREETGFSASKLTPRGGFYTVPGFCNEYLHLFFAEGLMPDPLPGDEDENIELVPTPIAEIPGLIQTGAIRDAKSIAGLAIYLAERLSLNR